MSAKAMPFSIAMFHTHTRPVPSCARSAIEKAAKEAKAKKK